MTSRQFVAVALRVFALWLGVQALRNVLLIFIVTGNGGWYVSYAVVLAVFAVLLWVFPLTVAGRILPAAPGETPGALTENGLVHAAVVSAGLVLVVTSLPALLDTIAFVVANPEQWDPAPFTQREFLVKVAIRALQLGLALLMVLEAPMLVRLLRQHNGVDARNGDL